jgi:sugar lactone lactonase YvrE
VRQILRVIVAGVAVAALAGGGTVAFADRGPGDGTAEHGGHHKAGDHHGKPQGPAHGGSQPAGVYTLSEPQHGNPEGVAFDKRSGHFFVSSVGDGSIYRGTLGDTATPVPVFIAGAAGSSATGLKIRRGKLYAAGASTGTIKVYDVDSGALLATFDTKGGDSSPTFVNDLDVTRRGDVYATDSSRPVIYHLSAEEVAAGTPAPKPIDPADVIATSPEIPFTAGAFNLNGIVVRDSGRRDELVVVDSHTGRLFRVKVGRNGRRIQELQVNGGPFPNGDGLLIDRGRLIVVQNSADGFPNGVVDFVGLRHDGRKGSLEQRQTDPSFQDPSTIARARDQYLIVNPDFATNTPPFTVTALAR